MSHDKDHRPLMDGDREVGGLWCHEVLGGLSDYLDGELTPEVRTMVEAHLQGCDTCANFGGRVGTVLSAVKSKLAKPAPLENALRDTLLKVMWADRD